jgi:hypothetical protein
MLPSVSGCAPKSAIPKNEGGQFSKENTAEPSDADGLRRLLEQLRDMEVADLDPAVGQRVGELIARAVFDPSKQVW